MMVTRVSAAPRADDSNIANNTKGVIDLCNSTPATNIYDLESKRNYKKQYLIDLSFYA